MSDKNNAFKEDFAPKHAVAKAENPRGSKPKIIVLSVLLVALLGIACAGGVFWYTQQQELDRLAQGNEIPDTPAAVDDAGQDAQDALPENPIDFASLKAKNPDIYAWVYIPDTNVNVPILQSTTDDTFYLDHNENGDYSVGGAAFTQRVNSTDFLDPVTLVYGHYVENDGMFSTLHYFEDKDFFDSHKTMYVYLPERILTYEIIAAYQYDDRHIMNSFDFSNGSVVESYFQSVLNPTSMLENVREGATLGADDKIVQLSTCMDAYTRDNTRYIVTGVLVDEQQTR